MIKKEKAARQNAAASKSFKKSQADINIRSLAKGAIVYCAVRNLVSASLAEFPIRRGGLRHE